MKIQPCNSYNNSFGSKVITTSGASAVMNDYKPHIKKFMKQRIAELENNGNKDVVVLDVPKNANGILMTVYQIINGKLYRGKFSSRFEMTKASLACAYQFSSSNPKLVKETGFDKYNPLYGIIKDLLKISNNSALES